MVNRRTWIGGKGCPEPRRVTPRETPHPGPILRGNEGGQCGEMAANPANSTPGMRGHAELMRSSFEMQIIVLERDTLLLFHYSTTPHASLTCHGVCLARARCGVSWQRFSGAQLQGRGAAAKRMDAARRERLGVDADHAAVPSGQPAPMRDTHSCLTSASWCEWGERNG
jgi:hypothetical protein